MWIFSGNSGEPDSKPREVVNGFADSLLAIGGMEGFLLLTFALFIGHSLGDYPLQGAFLSSTKNRYADSSIFFGESEIPRGLWIHALTAHSLIQSGMVWIITGSAFLGLLEFVLHWITDFFRCEGRIGFNTDQFIHFGCKILIAIIFFSEITLPF